MNYSTIELKDIAKKKPFIYEIDGDLYAIGNGVFRKLTSEEETNTRFRYEEYKQAISEYILDNIEKGAVENKISKRDFDLLISRARVENDNHLSESIVLEKVNGLSDKVKVSLLEQMKYFIAVYRYFS